MPSPALPPTDLALSAFRALARRALGVELDREPAALSRRLRMVADAAGLDDLDATRVVDALERAAPGDRLFAALCDAVPNHETSFFRDESQLAQAVSALIATPGTGTVRLLSAGCSSGEELYSLSMLAFERLEGFWGRRVELWGVDVSPAAIGRAQRAWYPATALARAGEGPACWQTRHLRAEAGGFKVREYLRQLVRVRQANLLDPGSLGELGPFDVVVCRNVLIHFSEPAAERAIHTLRTLLGPGGTLLLGAPEAPLLQPFAAVDEVRGQHLRRRPA